MNWVIQDIILQYLVGIGICFVIYLIWKITNKGEKL